jgi:hypothetical protein
VKKLYLSWSAVAILAPVVVVCAVVTGSIHGTAPALAAKKKASLQVAFITNVTGLSGAPANHIQNVFLNVSSVRVNPKPKPGNKNQSTPAEGSSSWVTIPVPTGVGGVTHGNPGDLQIDMIAGQSQAQYYNTGSVTQKTYYTVELEFDTSNPGFVVPNCPSAGPREGCINYPVIFQDPGAQVVFNVPQGLQVTQGALNLLLIQINVSIVSAPSGPGQPYTVNVTIAQAQPGNYLGVVSGTVSGASGAINKKKTKKLSVTANLPGTATVVASAPVSKTGTYNMYLPAVPGGSIYDLYAAGGGGSYEAVRTTTALTPSAPLTVDFANVTTGHSLGVISGAITDQCTGKAISGATLQLLIPADSAPTNTDCSMTPNLCVTVASATTDNVGGFPQPGTVLSPSSFNQVPIISGTTYTLEVSASGYDTLLIPGVKATSGGGKASGDCGTASSSKVGCDLSLTTGYINGTVDLGVTPQNGEIVLLQVFAEMSGTSDLVAALPAPVVIRGPNQTANFTLNVPTAVSLGSAATLDMFAQAIDLYQGASDPYPGHSIITESGVPVPAASCANSSANPAPFVEPMVCTGHGSVAGITANPNTGTTVALSKNGVILTTSPGGVPYPAPSPSNTYSFCAPPDLYSVQRFEQHVDPIDSLPTPLPVGTPTAVGAMATPQATSTPCPSTCFSGMTDSSGNQLCPGICGATFGPAL